MTRFFLISAHILDCYRKLRSFRKWDKAIDNDADDATSYTTQYQEAFLNYVENEYWAKHRHLPIITPESVPNNNHFSSEMGSRSGQSSYDPYDLSSDDEEYIMPEDVAKMTPGQSECSAP